MPSKDERIQAAKKLRKALQIALSAVELEPGDVADLAGVWDDFDPSAKYKKGEVAIDGGVAYVCLKTVKSGAKPSTDPGHWAKVDGPTTEVPTWDAETAYSKGDHVRYPDAGGMVYVSQKNNNIGIQPGTNEKYWIAE